MNNAIVDSYELKHKRVIKGLSQQQLAKMIGCQSGTTVSDIESGVLKPKDLIKKMCDILGCSFELVYKEVPEEKKELHVNLNMSMNKTEKRNMIREKIKYLGWSADYIATHTGLCESTVKTFLRGTSVRDSTVKAISDMVDHADKFTAKEHKNTKLEDSINELSTKEFIIKKIKEQSNDSNLKLKLCKMQEAELCVKRYVVERITEIERSVEELPLLRELEKALD